MTVAGVLGAVAGAGIVILVDAAKMAAAIALATNVAIALPGVVFLSIAMKRILLDRHLSKVELSLGEINSDNMVELKNNKKRLKMKSRKSPRTSLIRKQN